MRKILYGNVSQEDFGEIIIGNNSFLFPNQNKILKANEVTLMNNSWTEIKTQKDIDLFMDLTGSLHDSCLKELKYLSGMYVDEESSMQAVNNKRQIHMILQSQWEPHTIEIIFDKVSSMNLNPSDENYDGIIMGSHIAIEDGNFVWFDSDDFQSNYNELYNHQFITYIKSENIKWKICNKHIGKNLFFTSNQIK